MFWSNVVQYAAAIVVVTLCLAVGVNQIIIAQFVTWALKVEWDLFGTD